MDEVIRCGNDLRTIEYWLHHRGPGGDPHLGQLVSLLDSVSQVLMTSFVTNEGMAREIRAEASKAVVGAAQKFAAGAVNVAGA